MAEIRKGKFKGTKVSVLQWCNDWFMVDPGGIISPTNIILDEDEMKKVSEHKNSGLLFGLFDLLPNGTFKRRRG
jgi:hypothetical protein